MTELVFILDRSGSMAGLEVDTIGGFNSMIARQKQEAGEALVSTVLFDNESVVIHDRLPLAKEIQKYVPKVMMTVVDTIPKEEIENCRKICEDEIGAIYLVREYIED